MRGGIGTILSLVSGWGLQPLPLVHMMSGLVKWQFFLLALKVRRGRRIVDARTEGSPL